ncbi:MAG: M14/M99 family metallopeptidase, partial [Desulfobacterales bacterium]|nr:M14/M99 family metallopeptidase [Desulfobacterales bacterium]
MWLAGTAPASQSVLDFSVHTLASKVPGKTALIVGGIQGDEPGGFNAAALIATRYKILSGQVIVVPNLNFESIIKRSRGVYGDMNRKFDQVSKTDPERKIIAKIKSMITDPNVDFILNLHDGSGFFTPTREGKMRNPDRWGQSIIVDQALMPENYTGLFSDLAATARQCADNVNAHLIDPGHTVYVKNTRTAEGDRAMAKTLTFFAMKNKKPAFGIEASKSFLTPGRVYYHLRAIESFFLKAGIAFKRDFSLNPKEIKKAIDKDIALTLGERRILLYAENIRNRINYLPMEKDSDLQFLGNNPLLAVVHNKSDFSLYHGNRCLSHLSPQYFEYDLGIDSIEMDVDGKTQHVPFGSRILVKKQ